MDVELPHEPILGVAPVYNEVDKIRGWVNNISLFCDEVVVLVDRRTNDGTVDVLRDEFPEVSIEWQVENGGDSDRHYEGLEGVLNHVVNLNIFLHTAIPDGGWVLPLSVDRRLDPSEPDRVRRYVDYATRSEEDGIVFDESYVFVNDDEAVERHDENSVVFLRKMVGVHLERGIGKRWYGLNRLMRVPFASYHFVEGRDNWWNEPIDGAAKTHNPFVDWRNDGVEVD